MGPVLCRVAAFPQFIHLLKGKMLDAEQEVPYANHSKLFADNDGDAKNALKALADVVGQYNGTYNPTYAGISYDMLRAGIHLGITAWPWTYNKPDLFAQDYLFGMWGLTTNFSSWVSDLPESFVAVDTKMYTQETRKTEEVFTAMLSTYQGEVYLPQNIELVIVSGAEYVKLEDNTLTAVSAGTCLMMLHVLIPLVIGVKDFGSYYIYSNPVTLTVESNK